MTHRALVWPAAVAAAAFFGPSAGGADRVRYDGHRVVRVHLSTQEQLDTLLSLTDDVWSEAVGVDELDVRVSPDQFDRLVKSGLPFDVFIADVQALIDAEADSLRLRGADPFGNYMDNAQVVAYLNTLAALRPDLAQTLVIGQTVEGRNIVALRITGPGAGPKPAVVYHGCEHAREWISVPVPLFLADRLIRDYEADLGIRRLVDRCEFYVVPVFNVDGYVYSWTSERLWRKNRRNNGNGTFGVDINRNWGYQWGGAGSSGTSSNDTYRGPSAFSEPETRAMRDLLLGLPQLVTYNDIHSYSQLLLWPWGYTPTLTPDEAIFREAALGMIARIFAPYQESYKPGAVNATLYPASGVSIDWTYGVLGVFGYSFELRDTGSTGFLLPAAQIRPNCEEIFPALMHQADYYSAPVRVDFPVGLPAVLAPGASNTIRARITAARQAVDPDGATLFYRTTDAGPYSSASFVPVGGGEFEATLPPRACGDPTRFYIVARGTDGGEVYQPPAAPDKVFTTAVGTEATLFDDNFETSQGWTVQNVSVSSGAWVRVDPVGTSSGGQPVQPEDDNPAGVGTMCYVTGQGSPGGAASAADLDGGPTRLISPVLALAAVHEPFFRYYRWTYASPADDALLVEISNDNGQTWTLVESVPHAPAWTRRQFRVADFVTPTDQVRLRFSAYDNPNNSTTEAAIDDVQVIASTCATVPVPGDLNCDGLVDDDDVPAFARALIDPAGYAAEYPDCDAQRADLNGDQATNGDDVQPFVGLVMP